MIRHLLRACQGDGLLLKRRYYATKAGKALKPSKCKGPPKSGKASTFSVDPKVLEKMDEGFARLVKSKSTSLLKKHLTPQIYIKLRTKHTKSSSLMDCIQSGLANLDSGCGVYAPDAEAYQVFAPLFDPIIKDYHFGFRKTDYHPALNFGNPCIFGDLDPLVQFIASTRIRCARSVQGFPFNPRMTKQHYDDLEDLVHCTLSNLPDEFSGKYHPLFGMNKDVKKKLIDDHFLFKEGDRFLKSANASRFWPIGRGIYHNFEKTFVVWCNEEDHIRIISMQRGGDFAQVFSRLVRGINHIEKKIAFTRHDRLGYLTFCPTNLGTTIRASVHIRLPKLATNKKKLEEVAAQYKLQVRGTRGEHSEAEEGIYDISNRRRLGITEFDAVKELFCGINEIISLEKAEKGRIVRRRGDGKTKAELHKAKAEAMRAKEEALKAQMKADQKAGKRTRVKKNVPPVRVKMLQCKRPKKKPKPKKVRTNPKKGVRKLICNQPKKLPPKTGRKVECAELKVIPGVKKIDPNAPKKLVPEAAKRSDTSVIKKPASKIAPKVAPKAAPKAQTKTAPKAAPKTGTKAAKPTGTKPSDGKKPDKKGGKK